MHRTVDPSTTLRHEDFPAVRSNGPRLCAVDVFSLVLGMVFEKQRGQVSVLTQMEQIFHMQRINSDFSVCLDDLLTHEKWFARLGGAYAIHCETAWETSD